MTITADTSVGAVATEHPLATRVFARHGIDFCCGGGRPLADICEEKGLPVEQMLAEIETEISAADKESVRWDEEPIPALIEHIVRTFHEPHREELPRLVAMAKKVNNVHGHRNPDALAGIEHTIMALRAELEQHMMKEEQILFPMIASGQGAMAGGPISVMEQEHVEAGEMLRRLRELTDDYTLPEDACNTWRALWAGLEDFERAVHEHIHLENNILHKRALEGASGMWA